jgi:hypothetical protein
MSNPLRSECLTSTLVVVEGKPFPAKQFFADAIRLARLVRGAVPLSIHTASHGD